MKSFGSFFIIALFIYAVQCRINFKLTNLQCKSMNADLIDIKRCSLKAVKKDIIEMTVHAKLFKPIHNASLILRLRKRGDYKTKPLLYYKIDVCEFMRNSRRNPIADIFYRVFELERYSNLNHTCPYDHDLILDRSRLNIKPLNIITIAQGEYTIYTSWTAYEKPLADIDFFLKIA